MSFTDDRGFAEGPLTSEPYPATGTIALADGNHPATGVPAITGTARVGQTLTADLSGIADEDGTTQADNDAVGFAYTYQWVQVDGSSETDITNATTSTYTLAAEDAGKTVKVTVSFTDDADFDEGPLVSEPYPATGTIALADGNHPATGVPAITGMAWVGQTLTADLSGIADEDGTTQADNNDVGFAYTYQWVQVDGSSETDITGATSKTYTLAAEDAGKTVKVTVSFTDDAGFAEGPLTSEAYPATGTVLAPPQVTASLSPAEQTVGIGQTASVTLRIVVSQAPDDVLAYRVQTNDGTANAGDDYIAVVPKLEELSLSDLTAQDDGSYVYERTYELTVLPEAGIEETFYFKIGQLYVRAHEYYATTIEGKKKGALIRISTNAATGQPTITGTAQVGQTLTAGKGTIADINGTTRADNGETNYAYTYQWVQVDGSSETDITGATSKTYTLAPADAGQDGQGQGELHRRRGQRRGSAHQRGLPGHGDDRGPRRSGHDVGVQH